MTPRRHGNLAPWIIPAGAKSFAHVPHPYHYHGLALQLIQARARPTADPPHHGIQEKALFNALAHDCGERPCSPDFP